MNTNARAIEILGEASARTEARYRVLLNAATERTERQIRKLITAKRGDLRALERRSRRRPEQLDVHLGERWIHDIIDALEAAGFTVHGVVATRTLRRLEKGATDEQ